MKIFIVFFLSLTFLAAHAQYNQSRTHTKSKPSLLSYYGTLKPGKQTISPLLRLPAQPSGTVTTQNTGYSLYNNSTTGAGTQQGYWSGSQMTTSGANGRFQSIQSFDMNGNLRETKATYQFSNRKKKG
jgi:hypothetical protein